MKFIKGHTRTKKGVIPKNINLIAGWNKGKQHTEEHKTNLKKAWIKRKEKGLGISPMKGRKQSEEAKQKIRDNAKINRNFGCKGKRCTEEKKERIRNSLIGHKYSNESRQKMRKARFEYIKKVCGVICPNIGHNEKQILDKLENELNYKIIRQYEVEGYFLDGYIQELNLAIEVDEKPKNKERDIERQKIIENKLGCKFMRIKDYD